MVARPNEQAYVVESSLLKTFVFKHNRKFFKKNERFDDDLKKKKRLRHARSLSVLRRIRAS